MGRAVLVGSVLAAGVSVAGMAHAAPFSVVTTGTIASGSNPADIAGLGTSLAGDSYTLTVSTDGLDPTGYYSAGSSASDQTQSVPGAITLAVNGQTLSTSLTTGISFSATEDTFGDITTTASGLDGAGNFASASQIISGEPFVATATLQTPFSYTLAPASDSGSDSFTFDNAANTASLSFSGTPTQVSLQVVPEPASWALLVAGMIGMGAALRFRPRRAAQA